MVLEAGKRDRMVWYNLHRMIADGLELLGWLDDPVANNLKHQQVYIPWGEPDDSDPVPVNTVRIMPEDNDFEDMETGSHAQMSQRVFVVDIYAENHAIGMHLRGDISAMLRGHLASVGRDRPVLEVYDYDLATPAVVAVLDIENVREDRARGNDPWERYWYSIMLVLEDEVW